MWYVHSVVHTPAKPMLPHHARIVYLGGVVKRALESIGEKAYIVRYVDDKGIQLRKFAAAVEKFGEPKDPVEAGKIYAQAQDMEPISKPARIKAVERIIQFYHSLEEILGGAEDLVYWESDSDEYKTLELLEDLGLVLDYSGVGGEILFSADGITFPLVREDGSSTFKLRYIHFVLNHLPAVVFIENRLQPLGEAIKKVASILGKKVFVVYGGRSKVKGKYLKGRAFNWQGYELESIVKKYDPKLLCWHFLTAPLGDFEFAPEKDRKLLNKILSRPARKSVFAEKIRERWNRYVRCVLCRPTRLGSTIRSIWGVRGKGELKWWDKLLWIANLT